MSGLSLIDVWYRRLPRYLFIEDRLRDQPVLELGCGSGLGADFLVEQGAGRVVGVDADERQILKARARYKRPNLTFEVAQGADLPFADGEFGLVLIPEGSQAVGDGELLSAVRRVLRPDGLCLVAAPNGDLEEPDPEGLSYYDMIESLEPVFPSVTMVAQTPMFAFTFVDFLASAEELDVGLDDTLAQDLVDDVAYYVALCTKEPYSPEVFAITQVPFAPVARRVQHLLDGQPPEQVELGELQEALAAEREERLRLDDASGDLERDLLESQNIMRDLRARLAEAAEHQAATQVSVEPLQAELADVTRALEALQASTEELERERDGLRDQAERYVKRAEVAEQEREAVRQEAADLHQAAQSQSAALSEVEDLRGRADQSERDRADLSARLADVQAQVERRAAERDEALEALDRAERDLVSARADQDQHRQRATDLRQELDEVGQELERRGLRIAELERDLAEVRDAADQGGHRIVELERDLAEVRDAADQGGHRIVELERDLGEVRGDAERRDHRVGELERDLSVARGDVEQRGHRLAELEQELGEAHEALDQRGQRVGELERVLDEAREEAAQRKQRTGELERVLDEAREEAAQRKQRTGELKREVEIVGGRADGLQERIDGLERALDSVRAEADLEQDRAATRIEQLRQQIGEAEAALGAAQNQCSGLEDGLAAAQEAARRSEEQREATQARLAESLEEQAALGQRLEAMEVGLDSSREEVRSLKTAADQAHRESEDREEELRTALERLSGLNEQLAQASDQAGAAAAELGRVEQQLLAADEQRAKQDGLVREVERDLATALADRRSLEVRLEQALIRADQSEVSGEDLRTRKKDLESRLIAELEESRAAQAQARNELEQQRSDLEEARSQGIEAQTAAARSEEALTGLRFELEEARAAAGEREATAADMSNGLKANLRDAEALAAVLEQRAQGLVVRLIDQENQTHGVQDRLRSVADALVAREAELGAVQRQLVANQADRAAREGRLAAARREVTTLEQALVEERQVRAEIETSLDAVETSVRDLSDAGERAVREVESARQEAADQAAEAAKWQRQCEDAWRDLHQARDRVTGPERAPEPVDMSETVGQLRTELEAVRSQGAALGAERARLMRQASLAEDGRDAVAERLEAAERAHEVTARGMEMVIARLESERERAEALDREVRDLRTRVEERGEFTVKVTREAAAEAQRARQYRRELKEVENQAESLRAELDRRTAELQEAREGLEGAGEPAAPTAPTSSVPEGQGVSDWDAEIHQGRLRTLEADQAQVHAELQERKRAQVEMEARLQVQADHVQQLLAGAEQHRLEMADREIALAEQAAWNAEMVAEEELRSRELESAREAKDRCAARLAEAQTEAKHLGVRVARLEGEVVRHVAEVQELRHQAQAASTSGVDDVERRRALEEATREVAAHKQQLDDANQALAEREDRIEELEALLDLAKRAKGSVLASPKKRETLIGIGPETQEIPPYTPEPGAPAVDLAALRSALDEVRLLEKACQMEEERITVLATSLARLGDQAGTLQDQLLSDRQENAEVEKQRLTAASQAARLSELELELEVLRTQAASEEGGDQSQRADLAERLLQEQRLRTEEAVGRSETRITELNNTIGGKDAEILLLHASMESMQRRVGRLAANIQEALRGEAPPSGESTQALLDRVRSELEGLAR